MPKKEMIRLALRQEGEWWVAYLAKKETMADAMEIGRILLSVVRVSAVHKQVFMNLMSEIVADGIEHITGARPDMECQEAPVHERAGNA